MMCGYYACIPPLTGFASWGQARQLLLLDFGSHHNKCIGMEEEGIITYPKIMYRYAAGLEGTTKTYLQLSYKSNVTGFSRNGGGIGSFCCRHS